MNVNFEEWVYNLRANLIEVRRIITKDNDFVSDTGDAAVFIFVTNES